jgi:hypothetical protein
MTGFLFVIGDCYRCKRLFGFNADRVPSLTVDGVRQPFCRDCVDAVNPIRIAKGLQPIIPLPGAYDPEEV